LTALFAPLAWIDGSHAGSTAASNPLPDIQLSFEAEPPPLPKRRMFFTMPQFADYLCLHVQTARRMRQEDPELRAAFERAGRSWVISRQDLVRIALRRGWPMPR
jgi:hypothetical protein